VIGSFARILSHAHNRENYEKVTLLPTTIGANARIASHSIVLAGTNIADGESVGSFPSDKS
jgi:acetyltransferase-like isoleucine patch superfamily enzyme